MRNRFSSMLIVSGLCLLGPREGQANIVGSVFYNTNIQIQNNINIFLNFFNINSPGSLTIVNLGGIFIDPPVTVDASLAMDPFCVPTPGGMAGGGSRFNSCPDHSVPAPTATNTTSPTSLGTNTTVTKIEFDPDPGADPTLTGATVIHYGFQVDGSAIGKVVENPQNVKSFITLMDTNSSTCGGPGQPPCQHTFDFSAPTPIVKSNCTVPTKFLVVEWMTSAGEGFAEDPVCPGYTLSWADYFTSPIAIASAGFMVSDTAIPLPDLNGTDTALESALSPLPTPGTLSPTPEPSLLLPLAAGIVGILMYALRRSRHARHACVSGK